MKANKGFFSSNELWQSFTMCTQRVSIYYLLISKIYRDMRPPAKLSYRSAIRKKVVLGPETHGPCHKSKEKLGKFHIKCQTSMARWGGIPKWLPNDPLCSPFDPKNRIVSLGPGHFKNLGRPGSTSYRLAAVAFSATMNWGQRVGGGRRY